MNTAAEHLQKVVCQNISPSEEEWQDFISRWQPYKFPKNHILTDFGEIEPYFYFVHEGVIRGYFEKNDQEYSIGFSYHGEFSGVYDSFIMQKPAQFCMETLTDTQGIRIAFADLMELYNRHKVFERWGRQFSEMILCGFSRLLQSLIADSAEEKFNRLITDSPHVFQLIPQKHLASYLGMTPETFSRMRKKAME